MVFNNILTSIYSPYCYHYLLSHKLKTRKEKISIKIIKRKEKIWVKHIKMKWLNITIKIYMKIIFGIYDFLKKIQPIK